METKNTHQSISSTNDGSATEAQVNFLLGLYRETLKATIANSKRPSYDNLKQKNDYQLFRQDFNSKLKGSLALHAWNTFIPSTTGYTKHKVSALINDAHVNKKFDKAFIKAFLTSADAYKKPTKA
jgi:hypothetical protein